MHSPTVCLSFLICAYRVDPSIALVQRSTIYIPASRNVFQVGQYSTFKLNSLKILLGDRQATHAGSWYTSDGAQGFSAVHAIH